MKTTRKKYSTEFKVWAAKASMGYKSVRLAAEKLKINRNCLQHWRNCFRHGKLSLHQPAGQETSRKETARLQKELKNTRLERDILKEGAALLRGPRRDIYMFIRENAGRFQTGKMCGVFAISPSCYYRWLRGLRTSRAERRIFIASEISRIYHWSEGRYGSPRISRELAAIGIKACPSLVRKIMAEQQLRWIAKSRLKKTTHCSPKGRAAENLLNQNFKAERPNQAWVSDLTYIRTADGWAYLTVVIDLFDRKVIGWSLGRSLRSKRTSVAAFKKAMLCRPMVPEQKLIFHSDRGIQYTSRIFVKALSKYSQISQSMSGKGNCYDNAVAESFFKTLKTELIYREHYKNRKQARKSVHNYIENFYNTVRRHSALGNLTIDEFYSQSNIS